jgi:5-oxoprolinase (ATP-hydrolysing)
VTNHPVAAGGSHLPDITVITPVWQAGQVVFFVASRGHHADVGGISPGSMPPHSKTLIEEGAMIVSFKLVRDGVFQVSLFVAYNTLCSERPMQAGQEGV